MIPSNEPAVLAEATFDKASLIKYHWVSLLWLCVFIVTIPIVLIVAVIQFFVMGKHIDSWSCILTERALQVKRGFLNKKERTIPLEKITDLSMSSGPIMRLFGLQKIGVETAGQSGAQGGSLVSLIGIIGAEEFRQQVIRQRDVLSGATTAAPALATARDADPSASAAMLEAMESIRTAVERIDRRLEDQARR